MRSLDLRELLHVAGGSQILLIFRTFSVVVLECYHFVNIRPRVLKRSCCTNLNISFALLGVVFKLLAILGCISDMTSFYKERMYTFENRGLPQYYIARVIMPAGKTGAAFLDLRGII